MAQNTVKETVNEIIESGRDSDDAMIWTLLRNASSSDFLEPLFPLDNIHWEPPVPILVHFVSGVCEAYLDRIGYYSVEGRRGNTNELEHKELSEKVARKLAQLLHRDRLLGLAHQPEDGLSMPPRACAAQVVAVCGATSYCDGHVTRRMREAIPSMGLIPAELGDRTDYDFGLDKFEEHTGRRL